MPEGLCAFGGGHRLPADGRGAGAGCNGFPADGRCRGAIGCRGVADGQRVGAVRNAFVADGGRQVALRIGVFTDGQRTHALRCRQMSEGLCAFGGGHGLPTNGRSARTRRDGFTADSRRGGTRDRSLRADRYTIDRGRISDRLITDRDREITVSSGVDAALGRVHAGAGIAFGGGIGPCRSGRGQQCDYRGGAVKAPWAEPKDFIGRHVSSSI